MFIIDFYNQMSYTDVSMMQQQNDMHSQRFHPGLNTGMSKNKSYILKPTNFNEKY